MMKKVEITVEAGRSPDGRDRVSDPASFSFIYGIGPGGLTPFEYQLSDKQEGDALVLEVEKGWLGGLFGHIPVVLPSVGTESGPICLTFRVAKIQTADQREIIRAMAEAAECGEGCCGH